MNIMKGVVAYLDEPAILIKAGYIDNYTHMRYLIADKFMWWIGVLCQYPS